MNFDAITIAAIADELRASVQDGRVQKVVQVGELAIGLEIYAGHRRRWLLLSADPNDARVHLTGDRLGRADERVSPLLLLLRKHLRGARLVAVEQPDFERVLALTFGPASVSQEPVDAESEQAPAMASGQSGGVRLIIETIGRYSNIVLLDEHGTVLECARRVTSEINRYRVVLPRQPYVPPPPQDKLSVERVGPFELASRLEAAPRQTAWQVLVAACAGVSPQLAREATHRATGQTGTLSAEVDSAERLVVALRDILSARSTGLWAPSVAHDGERVIGFAPYALTQHQDCRPASGISEAVEAYYSQTERLRPVDQARQVALRVLVPRREAAARKLESLRRALESGGKAERLRLSGETILGHVAEMSRGQIALVADGLEVALEAGLTPVENARAYFKRYRKARAALAGVPALIAETADYLQYIEQTTTYLALAESADQVRALQRELAARAREKDRRPADLASQRVGCGASARAGRKQRAVRREAQAPLAGVARYTSSDGLEILVGRSGRQNEAATFDLGRPDDVWLHARGVPGAHVLVRCGPGELPERTLEEAARLAAYFSASRGASSVAVDWTRRRQVRRTREGLPGLVSYSGERTLQVRPELPTGALP